jgi:hypothetical protein
MLDLVFRGGMLYDKGQAVEWGDRVLGVIEYHLRNVAAGYTLSELVEGGSEKENPRQRFLDAVEQHARPDLRKIGVRLVGIDIGQVIVPQEMRDALLMPVRHVALGRISAGLSEAIGAVNMALKEGVGEVRPQLLVNLTGTLGRILEESLRLSGPGAAPAGKPLLGPGQGSREEDNRF